MQENRVWGGCSTILTLLKPSAKMSPVKDTVALSRQEQKKRSSLFNPLTPTLGGMGGVGGHPQTLGRDKSLHLFETRLPNLPIRERSLASFGD